MLGRAIYHITWPLVISLLWWFLSDPCLLPPKMTRTSLWKSNWIQILHDPIIWRVWLFGKVFDDDVLCQSGKIPWFLRVSGFQESCFVWIGCHQGKTMRVSFLFWGDISGETALFKSSFFSDSRFSRIVHLLLDAFGINKPNDFAQGKISSYISDHSKCDETHHHVFGFCPKLPLVAAVFQGKGVNPTCHQIKGCQN